MDANSASATLDLAESHFAAGPLSDAEPLFRRVLGVSGDDVRVLHFLGYIARQNGMAGAAESYAAAVVRDPDNGQLHNNLAETAVASYRRAATLAPDQAVIHHNLGTLLHELHREQRAVAIQPAMIEARSEMCPALCALGRYREALEQYRAALAQQPDKATRCNSSATRRCSPQGEAACCSKCSLVARHRWQDCLAWPA